MTARYCRTKSFSWKSWRQLSPSQYFSFVDFWKVLYSLDRTRKLTVKNVKRLNFFQTTIYWKINRVNTRFNNFWPQLSGPISLWLWICLFWNLLQMWINYIQIILHGERRGPLALYQLNFLGNIELLEKNLIMFMKNLDSALVMIEVVFYLMKYICLP